MLKPNKEYLESEEFKIRAPDSVLKVRDLMKIFSCSKATIYNNLKSLPPVDRDKVLEKRNTQFGNKKPPELTSITSAKLTHMWFKKTIVQFLISKGDL